MGLREMAEEAAVVNGKATRQIEAGEMIAVALPDLSGSDVPVGGDVKVHVAWARVMRDCEWLGKNRSTESGARYRYRGIDDVMNVVGPALRRHGVFVLPTGIETSFEVIGTKSGSAMNFARCVVHFTIYGPMGDTMPASVAGEGFDSGDKSGSKAQSVALRTFYLNALAIQTNEPARDTEYGTQHEIAGPQRPSAGEYAAMILADGITVGRLQQIKEELYSDRATGATEVELVGGEKIRLVDLVQREGKRLVAGQEKGQ